MTTLPHAYSHAPTHSSSTPLPAHLPSPIFPYLPHLPSPIPHLPHLPHLPYLPRTRIIRYSPHTAADSVPGGVCDWLAGSLGAASLSVPVTPNAKMEGSGSGRIVTLEEPVTLEVLVGRIKEYGEMDARTSE